MKRIVYLVYIGILLVSCDYVLDVEPENNVTFTNYFETEKDVAAIVNTVHGGLRTCETRIPEREILSWVADEYNDWSFEYVRNLSPSYYLSDENDISWRNYYGVIYNANLLIDNMYRVKEITEERKNFYLQQVYFAKGVAYFRIAQNFGDAPITNSSTDTKPLKKSSVKDVLAEALTYALQAFDLPKFEDLRDENGAMISSKQYASKGAVAALLANIYAWRAALNNDENDWQEAEKYCSMIIDGEVGFYELVETPEDVCTQVLKRNSVESIWEIQIDRIDDPLFLMPPFYICKYLGFPLVQGMSPNDFHYVVLKKETIRNLYGENDKRIDAYFYGMNEKYEGVEDNAFIYKWRYPIHELSEWWPEPEYKGMDVNRIVWRLADIFLLRAECRVRLGRADAVEDLNRIRKRAGIVDYSAAEGDLRYAIFKERTRELIFEGQRYYDIVRNGYWKTELGPAFALLTEEDIKDGALYFPVGWGAFNRNELMRQNTYWLKKQK